MENLSTHEGHKLTLIPATEVVFIKCESCNKIIHNIFKDSVDLRTLINDHDYYKLKCEEAKELHEGMKQNAIKKLKLVYSLYFRAIRDKDEEKITIFDYILSGFIDCALVSLLSADEIDEINHEVKEIIMNEGF